MNEREHETGFASASSLGTPGSTLMTMNATEGFQLVS